MMQDFAEWFHGIRSEQFYEQLEAFADDEVRLTATLLTWLDAAYRAGQNNPTK